MGAIIACDQTCLSLPTMGLADDDRTSAPNKPMDKVAHRAVANGWSAIGKLTSGSPVIQAQAGDVPGTTRTPQAEAALSVGRLGV
jgi:hypothetical protein